MDISVDHIFFTESHLSQPDCLILYVTSTQLYILGHYGLFSVLDEKKNKIEKRHLREKNLHQISGKVRKQNKKNTLDHFWKQLM